MDPGAEQQSQNPAAGHELGSQDAQQGADAVKQEAKGQDSERFYCPYPGCNRSFAELWRLKVHYRAPPDVRGSGKERGHGTELSHCPKCNKALKPGKHHVGCSGSRAAPRAPKRKAGPLGDDGDSTAQGKPRPLPGGTAVDQSLGPWPMHSAAAAAAAGASAPFMMPAPPGMMPIQYPDGNYYWVPAAPLPGTADMQQPPGLPSMQHPAAVPPCLMPYPSQPVNGFPHGMPHMLLPPSQPQAPSRQDPLLALPAPGDVHSQAQPGPDKHIQPTSSTGNMQQQEAEFLGGIFDDLPDLPTMVPSPPPLPSDFHVSSVGPSRMLFNFSQFDQRMPHNIPTATTAADLTDREALDLAEQHVVYDHTDDGELMQMLFGLADDVPTMATIHLHTWHNVDSDAEEGGTAGAPAIPLTGATGPAFHAPMQQQGQGPASPSHVPGALLQGTHVAGVPGQAAQGQAQHQHQPAHQAGKPQLAVHSMQNGTSAGGTSAGDHTVLHDTSQGQEQLLLDLHQHPLGGSHGHLDLLPLQPLIDTVPPSTCLSKHERQHSSLQHLKAEPPDGVVGKLHVDMFASCGDDRDHLLHDPEMHQLLQSVE